MHSQFKGARMRFNLKTGNMVCVLCIFLATACSLSGPPSDFLDSNVVSGAGFDQHVQLRTFLDTYNNKGAWTKDDNGWIYKIKATDKVSGDKNEVAMQFVNTGNKSVALKRIVVNGEEGLPGNVESFYNNVAAKSKNMK
jgi:hypothetical protein